MATYEDERKKQEQAAMSGTQQQNTQQPAQQPDNTQYQATMQALEGAKTQAPVYGGQYDQQIQDIYQQIVKRKKFSYDAAADPLYQQYKQQYTQQGQQAMRDTMGQAAALTGGYGSSYGQAVGQQQYDAYLQRLGEVLPETYSMALNQYNAEGDALTNQYAMLNDMATTDYNRYRDQLGDWQYNEALRRQDEETAYGRQQDAYNKLLYLINNTGYSPTDDELTAAGLTRDQADKLLYMWQLQNAGASGSGSGGGGGYYNTGGGGNDRADVDATTLAGMKQTIYNASKYGGINGVDTVWEALEKMSPQLSDTAFNELYEYAESLNKGTGKKPSKKPGGAGSARPSTMREK
jgi:hypothetical protein